MYYDLASKSKSGQFFTKTCIFIVSNSLKLIRQKNLKSRCDQASYVRNEIVIKHFYRVFC